MQTELTYNITMDDGNEYTVMITEDLESGHFAIDVFDDDGDMVDDEKMILEINILIESKR